MQSTSYQVTHNLDGQKLGYALEEHPRKLGWRVIRLVNEDLGCSTAGKVAGRRFDRAVTEVCLGKLGAVAARKASSLALNSGDWQQRVEVHRVVDTIPFVQETVYALQQSDDRLLLGLRGSLREYELGLLGQRPVEVREDRV